MFNLKTVGDKIKNTIIKVNDILLDKIAIHSRVYKNLHNRYKLNIEISNNLLEFEEILQNSMTLQLLTNLYKITSPSVMSRFDYQVARLTETTDIIVVSSEQEKERVMNWMLQTSGQGRIYTIDELSRLEFIAKNYSIYIFSSVWVKDQTKLINLLFKINSNKEKYTYDYC